MASPHKKRRQQSLSAFAQSAFERDIMPTSEEDVDRILKQIHKIDNGKVKHRQKIPSYVDRLLNNEERTRSRVKSANNPKINRQFREIREVKKVTNPLGDGPSAVHYSPNFESVLSSPPKHQFQKAEKNPTASTNLDVCTMGEMLQQWTGQLRRINFENPNATPIKNKRAKTALSSSNLNNSIPERSTVRPPPDSPAPPKPPSKVPGLISGEANRDSFLNHNYNPGPSEYQTVSINPKKTRIVSDFSQQASRPTTAKASTEIGRASCRDRV